MHDKEAKINTGSKLKKTKKISSKRKHHRGGKNQNIFAPKRGKGRFGRRNLTIWFQKGRRKLQGVGAEAAFMAPFLEK